MSTEPIPNLTDLTLGSYQNNLYSYGEKIKSILVDNGWMIPKPRWIDDSRSHVTEYDLFLNIRYFLKTKSNVLDSQDGLELFRQLWLENDSFWKNLCSICGWDRLDRVTGAHQMNIDVSMPWKTQFMKWNQLRFANRHDLKSAIDEYLKATCDPKFRNYDSISHSTGQWPEYALQAPSALDDPLCYGPINTWDVSNVADMTELFLFAHEFNAEIGGWDVANVKSMKGLFDGARDFNNGDPANTYTKPLTWDVSNVEDMSYMFRDASNFNQDLTTPDKTKPWDVSSVTNMSFMFSHCVQFNGNVAEWDISRVNSMIYMFFYAESFDVSKLKKWPLDRFSSAQKEGFLIGTKSLKPIDPPRSPRARRSRTPKSPPKIHSRDVDSLRRDSPTRESPQGKQDQNEEPHMSNSTTTLQTTFKHSWTDQMSELWKQGRVFFTTATTDSLTTPKEIRVAEKGSHIEKAVFEITRPNRVQSVLSKRDLERTGTFNVYQPLDEDYDRVSWAQVNSLQSRIHGSPRTLPIGWRFSTLETETVKLYRSEEEYAQTLQSKSLEETQIVLQASLVGLHPRVLACYFDNKTHRQHYLMEHMTPLRDFIAGNDKSIDLKTDEGRQKALQLSKALDTQLLQASKFKLVMTDIKDANIVYKKTDSSEEPYRVNFIDFDSYSTWIEDNMNQDTTSDCVYLINGVLYLAHLHCWTPDAYRTLWSPNKPDNRAKLLTTDLRSNIKKMAKQMDSNLQSTQNNQQFCNILYNLKVKPLPKGFYKDIHPWEKIRKILYHANHYCTPRGRPPPIVPMHFMAEVKEGFFETPLSMDNTVLENVDDVSTTAAWFKSMIDIVLMRWPVE